MALFFGLYSHSRVLDAARVAAMLEDFGRGREVATFTGAGFVLATVTSGEAMAVAQGESGIVGIAGNLGGAQAATLLTNFKATRARALDGAEGSFAAVLYDRSSHTLLLANDPFGVHPLFFRVDGDLVLFGSEYEPMLADTAFAVALDRDAIAEYFGLGSVIGDHTFVRSIRNLPPAVRLQVGDGEIHETAEGHAEATHLRESRDVAGLAASVADVLRAVMSEIVGEGRDVTHLLTGGADTRLMLSCLSAGQRKHVEFVTSCISALRVETDRDVLIAARIASRLHLNHRVIQVAHMEEPFGVDYFDRDRRVFPTRLVGGWHGGEFLGGFGSAFAPISSDLDRATVDRRLAATLSAPFLASLSRHPFESYERELAQVGGNEFAFLIHQFTRPFFTRAYNGSRGAWLQPCLAPNRRQTPFCDSRVLKLLLRVPADVLRDYDFYNRLYRDHFPELIDVPTNSPLARRDDACIPFVTEGVEPKDVVSRKYEHAWDEYKRDARTWSRDMYAPTMKEAVEDPSSTAAMQFVDFEAWFRRFAQCP